MKIYKKVLGIVITIVLLSTVIVGCGKDTVETNNNNNAKSNTAEGQIKTFTAFMAVPGIEIPEDNRMMNRIAEKIGAKADVKFLTGQTAAERIGVMIAGGEYPDFIDGSDGTPQLVDAGALIPLEDHLDNYPNLKNFYSEEEWNRIKKEDGHIYYIPQFGNIQGKNVQIDHNDEAFWIQKRVLKWAGFPTIKTVDEYFDLIQSYLAANPTADDGQKNIGFESLSDDWRYFCIENPPMFLAGYPNDGAAIVDPVTLEAKVYDRIPEAKIYFEKLNDMYNKGVVDPEAFTLSYDQYMAKLSSGRVVGMVDQYWNFRDADQALKTQNLDDRTYVPLGLVLEEGTEPKYFGPPAFNTGGGLGITVSCKDVEGALKFLNDLLDPEVMTMRYWGDKDVDYFVDADGLFYRNEEQRENFRNQDFLNKNDCPYDWFPHYEGMSADGINAIKPKEQPGEFYATLRDIDREILDAYGYDRWTDFLPQMEENSPWYPLWSARNTWTADTPYGIAWKKMDDVKHEWLPKVVMASKADFEKTWDQYMKTYESEIDYKAYEAELTAEVARRVALAKGK
ncbi:sugar ABC transporter substrate-binding protein [Cellulosilyticum sp. I15G10I2]|uniref:sugar ABC transporter substrate-binding protein n=1 Tax=Cellulosilyticum sp. I15G10I2 TaxID=1892843 RepID=UPI00085BC1E3|nr:sugar ABC transporter substrate-binding protein [Cellulosilyticum sp. I15G10I2]